MKTLLTFLSTGGFGLERKEAEGGEDLEGLGRGGDHQERLGKGQQQIQQENLIENP